MIVHGCIHGWRHHDGDARSEGGGGEGRHRRIIDAASHFGDGVGGGGSDEEQVRPALGAAEVYVLNGAVQLGYRLPTGGELQGIGVYDDVSRFAHHGIDIRPMTNQLPGQLHHLHGGDASADG